MMLQSRMSSAAVALVERQREAVVFIGRRPRAMECRWSLPRACSRAKKKWHLVSRAPALDFSFSGNGFSASGQLTCSGGLHSSALLSAESIRLHVTRCCCHFQVYVRRLTIDRPRSISESERERERARESERANECRDDRDHARSVWKRSGC